MIFLTRLARYAAKLLSRSCIAVSAPALLLAACTLFGDGTVTRRESGSAGINEVTIPLVTVKQSQPAPTIIVAHGCDGLSWNRHVKFWGGIVKSWGYNAVFPDSFRPRGYSSNEVCKNPRLVNADMRARDMVEAADWIEQQPWHKGGIGILGFSHGGSTVIRTANITSRIAAGVAYYPGCVQTQNAPKFPVQIHIGTADDWTPSLRCVNLAKSNSNYELFLYDGTTHAFDTIAPPRVVLGHQLTHDPNAASLAERRSKAFFDLYLQKP